MADKQEDEIDVSLILRNIQVNDSYLLNLPVPPRLQPEPGISIRSPQEINRNASINKSPRSITSQARRRSSSSSPDVQILETVKRNRNKVQRQNSSSLQRIDSEVIFPGFQTRYSKMKLIKTMIHHTSDGFMAHLNINRDIMLRSWERTLKSNIVSGNTNTQIERDASCSVDCVSQASEFTERCIHPSTNISISKENLPNNNLPIVNERLRHPSQSSSIVMSSPTLVSPSDDFRNGQNNSYLHNSSQKVPIGNGRLRHPSHSSSIAMSSPTVFSLNSPTVFSPSDEFRNPSPSRSLNSSEDPRIRSKNHDRIQCNNSSTSLWNPDPPQTLNSPTSESRLLTRNPDPPLSSFRQNSPPYDPTSLSRNPDPPHYNVQPTYENRICSSNPDPPQHNLQSSLEKNPCWQDPRRSYVENNESIIHTIHNNDSIRRIGSIDLNDNGKDKQYSTQQPIIINSQKQTDSHLEQGNPVISEVKDTVDINIAQRCTVYMKQLKCHKGDYCEKLHKYPREDKVVCKYFKEENGCRRSNTDCWFWHPGEEVVKYVPNNDAPLLVQPMGHVLGYIKEDKAKNPDKYKNEENPEVLIPLAVGNTNHTPLVIPSAVGNANHTPLGQRQIGRLDSNHSPLLPHLKRSISTNNVDNSNVQELGSPSTASKSDINSPSINHITTNSIGKSPIEVSRIKRSKPAKVGAPRKKTVENIDNISNGPIISESVSSKAFKIPKKKSINVNSSNLINEKIENMKTAKVDASRKKMVEQQNNISSDQIVSDSSSFKSLKIPKKSSINEKTSEYIKTGENTKTLVVSKNQSSLRNNENNENEITSNNNVENLMKTNVNDGKNIKSNRTKQEQNSKKGHENKKEKSSKKNKGTDTHMKRKARAISESEEEENAAEKTKVLKKQSSNLSSKEKEDKMPRKKSNKPIKKANKIKRPNIDSSDESDEDSSQAVVTKSKKLKSTSDESEEEIQPKKSIKRNKKANKFKKSIIESDEESEEGDHQPLTSGNESEEDIQVKKSKNFTKKIDKPRISRIDSSSESEKDIPQAVVTKNKRSKSNIDVEKQFSEKVKEEPIKTISKDNMSKKENGKKQVVIEEIILLTSDEESDIVKSETFLNKEVDGVNPVRERKAIDDVFWKINEVFDIIENAEPWRRTPNQTEQDLYTILHSLNLERIEDDKYPHVYNLDLNFRQLYIYFSEVNDRVQEHAWKCKHRYPNCMHIPENHQEDMSCCK